MTKAVLNRAKSFLRSTDGPTATKYAIMLALIVLVAALSISSLGTNALSVFSSVDGGLALPGGG